MSVKAIDFFRALDDSDLDPYETRYLLRVWRRGQCWQKVENIAAETGMSRRQAYNVRKALLEKGWLIEVIVDDRVAYSVAIPDCCISAPDAQEVHQVHEKVHTVHKKVHEVHGLPINRTTEVDPIKYINAREAAVASDGPDEDGKQRAWEAIVDLIEFWEELTRRKAPPQKSEAFRDRWLKPFNEIWIVCGRDTAVAKAKVQAVRNDMLAQGLTILDPAKLPGHVQTMIDRELLPMTSKLNGNGRVNLKNDPIAREAQNRAVLDQVAKEIETGEWSPWTI